MNSNKPFLRLLSAAFILTFMIFATFGYFSWNSYKDVKESIQQSIRILELEGTILHYDEVLTMSTKMASVTGDLYWEKRYKKFETELDQAIKQLISINPESFTGESAEKTNAANVKLVAIEKQAFKAVKKGNLDKAKALLASEAYRKEKEIYAAGMWQIKNNIEFQTDKLIKKQSRKIFLLILSLIVAMPLLITTWVVTYRKFMLYIDKRIQAESALRESEEKYRSMVESIKGGVYICSSDFRVEYMNPAMIKRTGKDATGEICYQAIHDLNEQCPECIHDKIQQGESAETKILSSKDNRYYNISHSPIFHQDGSISKMTIYKDMTDSKRAEEERVRLVTAIEQASESIIISDRQGTIDYVNPAFEKLSGFSREEIIGQNFRILKSDKHDEAFYREMYDFISRGHTWAGHIINTMKDGTLSEFETRISPVKDSSGEIINFVSVNRDITQEKALEAQLRHTQRMEAIGTLAGGIAHDFNNILSSVIGYTELALYDAKKGTLQYENLQEVLVAGSRAKDLVQQILTFSRQSDLEQKPINVQLIAKEALKMLRASIPSTIEIKRNIQSKTLVKGDATQIHQVLMNLCANAAQAMDDKGGLMTVDLVDIKVDSAFISDYPELKPGAYINLTVTDTGCGMAPEVLEKIFDPFFTTKEKGKGTGMGLSVVHGIIHSHGGSIYAYSEPGKGSSFRVFLPSIERRLKPEDRTEKPIPKGTERILFVDDELSIVNMGKKTLESLGYDVVTRVSSIEALEFFKTQPDSVDIVITDLTMPNMTGEELAKELMQIRPDIPVILCTGFSARMDEKKAMNMGIRAFISKPILKRELAETIRKVINSS